MSSTFAVIVHFEVKLDSRREFLTLLTENAQTSVAAEPHCLRFDIVEALDNPSQLWLYEVYSDREAFERDHLSSSHFLSFDTATRSMLVSKTVASGGVTEAAKT